MDCFSLQTVSSLQGEKEKMLWNLFSNLTEFVSKEANKKLEVVFCIYFFKITAYKRLEKTF